MAPKLKVGDIVYSPKHGKYGIIKTMNPLMFGTVDFQDGTTTHIEFGIKKGSVYYYHKLTFAEVFSNMLDFANYCITEGFTSNATSRDLVRFLNSRK